MGLGRAKAIYTNESYSKLESCDTLGALGISVKPLYRSGGNEIRLIKGTGIVKSRRI
jgi:hypothetical protein